MTGKYSLPTFEKRKRVPVDFDELLQKAFFLKKNVGETNASKTTIKKINKEKAETSEPHVAILLRK